MEKLTAHVSELRNKYPKHDIICLGDFNIDLMKQNNQSECLIEEMISLGFIQQVTQATRQCESTSSLIDHVYARSRRTLRSDIVISDISDHYPTLTVYPKWRARREKVKITKRWFKQESYEQLQGILGATEWESITKCDDIESSTTKLENVITEAMDIVAPIEPKSLGKRPINQLLTPGTLISIKRSNKLYRQWRRTKLQTDKNLSLIHI